MPSNFNGVPYVDTGDTIASLPATTRQLAQWIADNAVQTDDPRLSGVAYPAAGSAHSHPISQVSGLQKALDGKAASSHTHTVAQVSGLQAALDGKAASSHTHTVAQVSGLQAALDGKMPTATDSWGLTGWVWASGWGTSAATSGWQPFGIVKWGPFVFMNGVCARTDNGSYAAGTKIGTLMTAYMPKRQYEDTKCRVGADGSVYVLNAGAGPVAMSATIPIL